MKSLRALPLIAFISILVHSTAFATLDRDRNSTETDRQAFHGVKKIIPGAQYETHVLTMNAQTVREYIDLSGHVFCVTWRGMAAPDLQQLFGDHYQAYLDAEKSTPTPKGRAPKTTNTSTGLRVVKFGHMRDVMGKACIPGQMPAGVDVGNLQ
jgi:hypothetical protein